jgi:hypothetical protein
MAARIDDVGVANEGEEVIDEACAETVAETIKERRDHAPLPWIGALANPHLGPMLVLNDAGYFVPLFTAGDLVRGCRFLWRDGRR